MVPFGSWTPDEDAYIGTSLSDVVNVIPGPNCYYPWPSLVNKSNAITGPTFGAVFAITNAGFGAFVGTADALYRLNTSTGNWDDVSGTSSYVATASNPWRFTVYNDDVIAVNHTTPTQTFTIGSSSTFADLANAPRAAAVGVWGRHLVLGNTIEASTEYPYRVHASDIDNPTVWSPLATNNAFLQDFQDGGEVQGFSNSNNALIVQKEAIRRATLTGGAAKVVINKVKSQAGSLFPSSIVDYDGSLYFLANSGFMRMTEAGETAFIGKNRIDRWFRDLADLSDERRVIGAVDVVRKRIYWAFYSMSAGTSYDTILCYDIINDMWTKADVSVMELVPFLFPQLSIDSITTSIDDIDFSFDFAESSPVAGAITSDGRAATFSGDPLAATIVTEQFPKTGTYRYRVRGAMPVIDSADVTLTVRKKERIADSFVNGVTASVNRTGWAPINDTGRVMTLAAAVPQGSAWTRASGVEVALKREGMQ